MTRKTFVQKWLGNKSKYNCEAHQDEMYSDLSIVCDYGKKEEKELYTWTKEELDFLFEYASCGVAYNAPNNDSDKRRIMLNKLIEKRKQVI